MEAACGGLSDSVADLFGISTSNNHNNNNNHHSHSNHTNNHHGATTQGQGLGPLSLPSAEEVDLALDTLLNRSDRH